MSRLFRISSLRCYHENSMVDMCCWSPRLPLMKRGWQHYIHGTGTVYPKKYAHGFVVLCFVVIMQSFIMISHEIFIHIHQGCFAGTGAIVRLPQCQWSKPDGYGRISQCITTTKHSKAKIVCIFLGIYCNEQRERSIFLPPLMNISKFYSMTFSSWTIYLNSQFYKFYLR